MFKRASLLLTTLSLTFSMGLVVDIQSPVSADVSGSRLTAQQRRPVTPIQRRPAARRRLGFQVSGIRPSRPMLSGLSRGGACSPDGTTPVSPTALLPKVNREQLPEDQIEIESTLAAHPTIFVYVPQTTARTAEFILADANREPFYQTTVPLPEQPGVIGIRVPDNVAALQFSNNYYWALALVCDETDRSGDLIVDGWIQRIQLNTVLNSQLARIPERDRPNFYANVGVWQDTLSALAQLRLANPQDASLTQDWVDLLTSVQLDTSVTQAPILGIETHPQELEQPEP